MVWLIDGATRQTLARNDRRRGNRLVVRLQFVAGLLERLCVPVVDAPTFGWLLPIAVIGLPALLAFFTTAFGTALARILWTPGAAGRVLALGVALTAEWLRGHLLTRTPGMPSDTRWRRWRWRKAPRSSAFRRLPDRDRRVREPGRSRRRTRGDPLGMRGPLVLAIAVLAGTRRLRCAAPSRTPTRLVDGVHLRVMQPNVQPDIRFNFPAKQEVMKRYIALSDRAAGPQAPGVGEVTHLIWPESAFPFLLRPRQRSRLPHQYACHHRLRRRVTYVAEWTGVPLSFVLERAGVLPGALCGLPSINLTGGRASIWRTPCTPQTLVAHRMNGTELPCASEAPAPANPAPVGL